MVADRFLPHLFKVTPVALGVLALGLAAYLGRDANMHNDFTQNVWLPARLLLDGANPYSPLPAEVDRALGPYRGQFELFNSGEQFHFIYPTWLAMLFAPLALLELPTALWLWRAANLLILGWSIVALANAAGLRGSGVAERLALGMALLLGLIFRESILTLYLGQFAIVELALLVLVCLQLLRDSPPPGRLTPGDLGIGGALALLATKPQSVGLVVGLLLIWAVSRRRWGIPAGSLASLGILFGGVELIYPGSLGGWLGIVFGGQGISQATVSASVWGLAYAWLGQGSLWGWLAAGLSLLGLLWLLPPVLRDLRDREQPTPRSLPLALCINSVISPYLLGYEHVLLLFPAILLLAAAGPAGKGDEPHTRRWRLATYLWLGILPLLVVVAQVLLQREFPGVAQSATMLLMVYFAGLRWRPAGAGWAAAFGHPARARPARQEATT